MANQPMRKPTYEKWQLFATCCDFLFHFSNLDLFSNPAVIFARNKFPETKIVFLTGSGGGEVLKIMGFKEDNGLQAPQRVSLGLDGTDMIQKSADNADVVDQLAGLSYKELRDLQTNIESGKTDGVPRELLG